MYGTTCRDIDVFETNRGTGVMFCHWRGVHWVGSVEPRSLRSARGYGTHTLWNSRRGPPRWTQPLEQSPGEGDASTILEECT